MQVVVDLMATHERSHEGLKPDDIKLKIGGKSTMIGGDRGILLEEPRKQRLRQTEQSLSDLARRQRRQFADAQAQLKEQLADVASNRMTRYHAGNAPDGSRKEWGDYRSDGSAASRGPRPSGQPSVRFGQGQGQLATNEFGRVIWERTGRAGILAGEAYVAEGTYSLPVSLPAGGVDLHFVRAAGDAEIRLQAVQIELFDRLRTSGAVLAVLASLGLLVQRVRRRADGSKRRLIVYIVLLALLLALLTLVAGPIGGAVAVAMILLAEVVRRALAARRQGAGPGCQDGMDLSTFRMREEHACSDSFPMGA